jgi:hypothetical protein
MKSRKEKDEAERIKSLEMNQALNTFLRLKGGSMFTFYLCGPQNLFALTN